MNQSSSNVNDRLVVIIYTLSYTNGCQSTHVNDHSLDRLPLPLLSAVLVLAGKCRTLGWIAFGTAMDMMYVRYERIRILGLVKL